MLNLFLELEEQHFLHGCPHESAIYIKLYKSLIGQETTIWIFLFGKNSLQTIIPRKE